MEVDVDQSAQIVPNLFGLDIQAESDINQPCEVHRSAVPSYLNIAILIVGTRGDVQPFVAIGKRLKVSIDLFIIFCFDEYYSFLDSLSSIACWETSMTFFNGMNLTCIFLSTIKNKLDFLLYSSISFNPSFVSL